MKYQEILIKPPVTISKVRGKSLKSAVGCSLHSLSSHLL